MSLKNLNDNLQSSALSFVSLSATSSPIKIEHNNDFNKSILNFTPETAIESNSTASSFSTGLNNMYIGSLPENSLIFLISQQATVASLNENGNNFQPQNITSTVNNQSIKNSVVCGSNQCLSDLSLKMPVTSETNDFDQKEQSNFDILASSLPPKNFLLNNFFSNNNNNLTNKKLLNKNHTEKFHSATLANTSQNQDKLNVFSSTLNLSNNQFQDNSSRTSLESFTTDDLTRPDFLATFATNGLVSTSENVKLDTSSKNDTEKNYLNLLLKTNIKLNNKIKTFTLKTLPNSPIQTMEEDQLNICNVCGDEASGRHYGASTCFGCKGFFRRTVRANKTYNCRYEERCEIDKIGRNTCRACRFRKCLEVGMEPDAIRPDRDKTGRQKNPRQTSGFSNNYLLLNDSVNLTQIETSKSKAAHTQKLLLSNVEHKQTTNEECFATLTKTRISEKNLLIDTLLEIERICVRLRDQPLFTTNLVDLINANDTINDSFENCTCSKIKKNFFTGSLTELILKPSLISPRTPLDYSGQHSLINFRANKCCSQRNFQQGFKRLLTLAIDFANTLKPIADINIVEKKNLICSFMSSYIVFISAFQSVSAGFSNSILLPNGRKILKNVSILYLIDLKNINSNIIELLSSKINFICQQIINSLQKKIEKLQINEIEYVCLKAIIALDSSASGIDQSTAEMLNSARDSVQNALFLHLTKKCSTEKAVFRFGQLLMLITNVSKIGAFLNSTIETIKLTQNNLSAATTLRFFSELDKIVYLKKKFELNLSDNNNLLINLRDNEMDSEQI